VRKDVMTIQRQTWWWWWYSDQYVQFSRGGDCWTAQQWRRDRPRYYRVQRPGGYPIAAGYKWPACAATRRPDVQSRPAVPWAGGRRNVEAEISAQHGTDSFGRNKCVVMVAPRPVPLATCENIVAHGVAS
jgi:hypothetical protein